MVMMTSQVQHLPPLHHAQCPLQATLHLPVQQPLIYFCRGFRSSAQIGTFIHTWPMDQYQTFGSHHKTLSVLVKNCVNTIATFTAHCTDVYLCSLGCEIIPLLDEYLHGNVCKDLENVKGGASGLQHFQCILSRACDSLHRCCFSNITCPFTHCCNYLKEEHLNNDCYMSWQNVLPDLFITVRLTRHCLVWRLWRKCLIIQAAISPFPQCRYIPFWFYT